MLNLWAILARKHFPYLVSLPLVKKKGQMRSFGNFPLLRTWVRIRSEFFNQERRKNWILLNEKRKIATHVARINFLERGFGVKRGGKRWRSDARILAWPWHVFWECFSELVSKIVNKKLPYYKILLKKNWMENWIKTKKQKVKRKNK